MQLYSESKNLFNTESYGVTGAIFFEKSHHQHPKKVDVFVEMMRHGGYFKHEFVYDEFVVMANENENEIALMIRLLFRNLKIDHKNPFENNENLYKLASLSYDELIETTEVKALIEKYPDFLKIPGNPLLDEIAQQQTYVREFKI